MKTKLYTGSYIIGDDNNIENKPKKDDLRKVPAYIIVIDPASKHPLPSGMELNVWEMKFMLQYGSFTTGTVIMEANERKCKYIVTKRKYKRKGGYRLILQKLI